MTDGEELRLFPFAGPDPWGWLPGECVLPGTIFVAGDGGFWRLVKVAQDGWFCEPVAERKVGSRRIVARVRESRIAYELAARAEADAPPESREAAHVVRMVRRDELAAFCSSGRGFRDPEAGWDNIRRTVTAALGVVFVLILVVGIRTITRLPPDQRVGTVVALGLGFVLLAAIGALVFFVPPWLESKRYRIRRMKIPSQLAGLALLFLVLLFGLVIVIITLVTYV